MANEVRQWLHDDRHEIFLAQELCVGIAARKAWRPRWNDEDDPRELARCQLPRGRPRREPEPCVLPAGHAGVNSFEYD